MEGQRVLNYRLLEKIGEGGMGKVYLAEGTSLKGKAPFKSLREHLMPLCRRLSRR